MISIHRYPLNVMKLLRLFVCCGSILTVTIFIVYLGIQPQTSNLFEADIFSINEVQGSFSGWPKNRYYLRTDIGKNLSFSDISKLSQLRDRVMDRIDSEGRIFLSVVDTAYVDMALNLYLTSYEALNINNFLFIGMDKLACEALIDSIRASAKQQSLGSSLCLPYFNETEGNVASVWSSKSFERKTHYKSKIILDALCLNVTVIIVDLDIVFFKNPLPYLNCAVCDIEIQSDIIEGNTGFYLARPTIGSIRAHVRALEENLMSSLSNQKVLDQILRAMVKNNNLSLRVLSDKLFPCGKIYFENNAVMFRGDFICQDCVLVHNNWIATKGAKIYRFKETGMWLADISGYYSDPARKYLQYDNPRNFGFKLTLKAESDALKAALIVASILNRTLILPKFHCYNAKSEISLHNKTWCSLNLFFNISLFDSIIADGYRESVFLSNAYVPHTVKTSISKKLLILTGTTLPVEKRNIDKSFIFAPTGGYVTHDDIVRWFSPMSDISVLRFHSMYGLLSDLSMNAIDNSRVNRISSAIRRTDYRQLLNI